MSSTRKILALAALCLAVREVHAECTLDQYAAFATKVTSCAENIQKGADKCVEAIGNIKEFDSAALDKVKGCFCPEFEKFFGCLADSSELCVDVELQAALSNITSSLQEFTDELCTGAFEIDYPTYAIQLIFAAEDLPNFKEFSVQQYTDLCEEVFDVFGYKKSDYSVWCDTWTKYIVYSGAVSSSRRRNAEDLIMDVTIPEGQAVPPNSKIDSVEISYTDNDGNTETVSKKPSKVGASVTGIKTAASLPQAVTVLATGLLTLFGAVLAL